MCTEVYEFLANWKFILAFITSYLIYNLFNYFKNRVTTDAKSVLITGCDSGFGYKTSLELNASKVKVFSGCLTKEGVKRLQDDPAFRGHAFIMDVTNQDDINKAYKLIKEETQDDGLWCVVNNAGILQPGLIDWQTTEEMQQAMNVNLWGTVNVTKTMLPLVKRARGRIVNVTSMAGRVLFGNHTAYSMSKFACEAFSDGLRYEMKPWDVSVHIIEPGMFMTPILDVVINQWEGIWKKQPIGIKEAYGEEYFNQVLKNINGLLRDLASRDIKKVTNTIKHATLSCNPKRRYVVGFDAHTIWTMIATLPTFMGDFILNFCAKQATPEAMKGKKERKLVNVSGS
ncbi:short-chain dehydrogenase/reductase family 9C member 7-like [Hydractinia symbiolongicarpus]|uniref:short-chain dehydrogenase/reductase family 9C member 7-like n=1 Tax=Hydractinia symbiolongicarpus TaxID=13093 RepID=UPI0025512BAC|nr:short-chain dehydrogenase/reductase family 9C member 7-like [Hydractinia symbiolongicarpus]